MKDIFGDDDGSESPQKGLSKKTHSQTPTVGDSQSHSREVDDFGSLLESSFQKKSAELNSGDRVYGEILSLSKDEVFVSLGPGQDGVVPKSELLEDGVFPFKVGEHLELFVARSGESLIHLTTKKSGKALAESLEDAFDFGTPIDGRVVEIVNGGFRVDLQGKLAFCPLSQIDFKTQTDTSLYLNKKFEFVITKFENRGKNIVVSRRKALELSQQENIQEFVQKYKVGDTLSARIRRIEAYGAFAEVAPGLDGLIPISELSHTRVQNPHEVVQLDQLVTVKILSMEDRGDQFRISLSKKESEESPWQGLGKNLQTGNLVKGRVTRCMPFGAFVEISPGIEGLVPLSEMSSSKRVQRSDEIFKNGDTITVLVKSLQPEERRITLSYKDAQNAAEQSMEAADRLAWESSQQNQAQSLGTLGDQFKDLMKSFKSKS
jgi:small subunit ribosomal protein S1